MAIVTRVEPGDPTIVPRAHFSPRELASLRPGPADRVHRRLLLRHRLKRVILRSEPERTGRPLDREYRRFELLPDTGTRRIVLWRDGTPLAAPYVSFGHSPLASVAVLSWDTRVAIDIETIERRHQAFYETFFSDEERQWVEARPSVLRWADSLMWTLLWCAKEATAKLDGPADFSLWDLRQISLRPLPAYADVVRLASGHQGISQPCSPRSPWRTDEPSVVGQRTVRAWSEQRGATICVVMGDVPRGDAASDLNGRAVASSIAFVTSSDECQGSEKRR